MFVVIPGLVSGLATTIDLLSTAVRRRDLAGANLTAWAAWDTYFQAHNWGSAMRLIPNHLSGLGESFDGKDQDDGIGHLVWLVALLTLACLLAGIVTTIVIIRATAATQSDRIRAELDAERWQTR